MGANQTILGVNSYLLDGYGLSIIHTTFMNRKPRLSQIIKHLYEDGENIKALCRICGETSLKRVPEGLLKLGIVEMANDKPKLKVPLIDNEDKKVLTGAIFKVGHELAEAFLEDYEVIEKSFRDLGYAHWMEGIGDYVEFTLHTVMGSTVLRLADTGILPPIPRKVPANWGVWLWSAPWTLDMEILLLRTVSSIESAVRRLGKDHLRPRLLRAKEMIIREMYYEANKVIEEIRQEVVMGMTRS